MRLSFTNLGRHCLYKNFRYFCPLKPTWWQQRYIICLLMNTQGLELTASPPLLLYAAWPYERTCAVIGHVLLFVYASAIITLEHRSWHLVGGCTVMSALRSTQLFQCTCEPAMSHNCIQSQLTLLKQRLLNYTQKKKQKAWMVYVTYQYISEQ